MFDKVLKHVVAGAALRPDHTKLVEKIFMVVQSDIKDS